MIQLKLNRDHNWLIKDFQVQGHSSLGKKGHNLLCAGISVLVQSLVAGIYTILKQDILVHKDEGILSCVIQQNQNNAIKEKINLILNVMEAGFQNLAKQFPNQITIQTTIEKPTQEQPFHQLNQLNNTTQYNRKS